MISGLIYLYDKAIEMILSVVWGKYVVTAHLNNTIYRFIQDHCFVMYDLPHCMFALKCTTYIVNITKVCLNMI